MTASATAVDWAVEEAAMELRLAGEVPTARLRELIDGPGAWPCRSRDPEEWFPISEKPEDAERLCAGCPVRALCLELAMRGSEHGIWGGTTTDERRNARRRQLRAAQARQAALASQDGTAA